MDSPNTAPPPPARPAPAAPSTSRPAAPMRAQWTPARQRIFLAALHETGSVTRAAQAAGMSRTSVQRLRRRLAGTAFDLLWDQVLAEHRLRLADPFAAEAAARAPRS